MGRGILRGAGGDENLKFNFIWPKHLLSQIEEAKLVKFIFICSQNMIKHILLAHCILCEFCTNLLPYFMMKCSNYRKHMTLIFIGQIRHPLYLKLESVYK